MKKILAHVIAINMMFPATVCGQNNDILEYSEPTTRAVTFFCNSVNSEFDSFKFKVDSQKDKSIRDKKLEHIMSQINKNPNTTELLDDKGLKYSSNLSIDDNDKSKKLSIYIQGYFANSGNKIIINKINWLNKPFSCSDLLSSIDRVFEHYRNNGVSNVRYRDDNNTMAFYGDLKISSIKNSRNIE